MAETDCCQRGLKSLIASKLGRCPRCIRAATIGTLAAWAVAAAFYGVWPIPALLWISLLVAGGFTLLLFAHLVAFTARLIALRQAIAAGDGPPGVAFSRGRRAATAQVLRMGLAALLASVFGVGLFGRPRAAQAVQCEGPAHTLLESLPTSLCAPNLPSARAQALAHLTKKGKKRAQEFCEEFSSPTCRQCNLKNAEFGALNCTDKGPCEVAGRHWDCTLLLVSVECKCGGGRYTP